MKKTSPIKTQICAASIRFNRYKEAPAHKNKMPSSKILKTNHYHLYKIIRYMTVVVTIILVIYYLPNYFFLEKASADHTTILLNSIGINVQTKIISENVYLANIKIVKDCTGVQVIAVFCGMLIPIPNAPLKKKLLTLVIISTILYVANVLRITLEFSLVHFNILPWYLAHYPLSLLLGIIGVIILVFVTDHILPEFGGFLFTITHLRAT